MALNLILDVDTGVDDAFALLFAARHPEINLLGVTCVDGNTDRDGVCKNTLYVLETAGAGDVPVAAGAAHPLMGPRAHGEHVHGDDGLGGLSRPPSHSLDPRHAIELIRDLVEGSEEPVTLMPVGPLTNIALFVSTYPETAAKLERIFLMGGSASVGNVSATAEFNVWHDPEAAHIVFSSAVPITMYGLDVFYLLGVEDDDVRALRAKGSPSAVLAADLVDFRASSLGEDVTLGDYGAVCSALFPELTTSEVMHVAVDTSTGPNRGQTICDRRPIDPALYPDRLGKPCSVILAVDADEMVRRWLQVVA